jgi:K+-transporting ATPase KdpF subunit
MYFIWLLDALSCWPAGSSPRLATSFRENNVMDYIIAGIASLGLFVYLIYALLRPEKF